MPRPRSVNLYRVARQCGVVLRDAKDHSPTSVRPRHCFCKATLKAIGEARGEEHLALVLRLIVETKGNDTELHTARVSVADTMASALLWQIAAPGMLKVAA